MILNNLIFLMKYDDSANICLKVKKIDEDRENCDAISNKYTLNNSIEVTQMEMIESKQLKSLENVKSLIVSNCKLKYLPNELHFSSLTKLDISNNNLTELPDFVLNHLENLNDLNISYNKIKDFNILPKCYQKLKYLYLQANNLQEIPQWIFYSSCISLEILDLSDNPLKTDLLSLISGNNCKTLNTLIMSNSNIKKYCKFFQEIPKLKQLSLSNKGYHKFWNNIQGFPFKLFNSVTTLTELQLSRLGYSYLQEDICELNALEILNISYNNISWLPGNFTKLKSLKTLDISHNELLYLPMNIDEMENINNLNLSFNLLGSLPKSIQNLNKLKVLDCYLNDFLEDSLLIINKLSSLEAFDIEQNLFDMKKTEQYLEMRTQIRYNKENRIEGSKQLNEVEDSDDTKTTYEESEDEITASNTIISQESWDSNDCIDDDAMLVLPPYEFKIVQKPVFYNPSDYIHPMYFDDALEDET